MNEFWTDLGPWPSHHHHLRRGVDRPVTAPDQLAVSLALVRKHLRYLVTNEDDLITAWIGAATEFFQEQTGRQILNATWEWALDGVPACRTLELPRPPLGGDVSIAYDDVDGNLQVFDTDQYVVAPSFILPGGSPAGDSTIDPYCGRGTITLATGASWPTVNSQSGSFRIRRTCGYGDGHDVVPSLVQSILFLLVAHFHRNRAEVFEGRKTLVQQLPLGAEVLIKPFKYTARPTRRPEFSDAH
jgi:hypothetical protein